MPAKNPKLDLPPLELECMKALWSIGEGTVEDVRSRLGPERPLAHTTVMTMMNRLAGKGALGRERRGRSHVYRPAVTEAEARDHALTRLAADFFGGSRERMREHLQDGRRPEDHKPIEPLVRAQASLSPQKRVDKETIDPSLL